MTNKQVAVDNSWFGSVIECGKSRFHLKPSVECIENKPVPCSGVHENKPVPCSTCRGTTAPHVYITGQWNHSKSTVKHTTSFSTNQTTVPEVVATVAAFDVRRTCWTFLPIQRLEDDFFFSGSCFFVRSMRRYWTGGGGRLYVQVGGWFTTLSPMMLTIGLEESCLGRLRSGCRPLDWCRRFPYYMSCVVLVWRC